MASSRVSSPEDAEAATRHISDLVDGIPLDLLAHAAFRCGAHARALQYYESYVRTKRGGALNPAAKKSATYDDAEVTFLQVSLRFIGAYTFWDSSIMLKCLERE